MKQIFRMLIEKAVWWRVALAFAATFAGAVMLFGPNAAYARLKSATGMLPEDSLGHQPGQTLSILERLTDDQAAAYLSFQLFDFVFKIVATLFVALAVARAIKAFPAWTQRLERLLVLPIALLAAEALENILLALMTLGLAAPLLEVAQQSFTTLKLWIGFILLPMTVLALAIAAFDGFKTAIGAKKP